MTSYILLVKRNGIFKFISYHGDFRDFLGDYKSKIYFKLKIPVFLVRYKKPKIHWYKRFCEDLYFLHTSGVSVVDSINIFRQNAEESKDKDMSLFYKNIYEKLLKGNSLYESIKSTRYKFDNMFLSLIKISEETGNLSEILENLVQYYEEKMSLKNQIKSSLLYPSLLLGVLLILLNLCILYFIPSYVNSFQTQISNLPSYSKTFINVCLFIKQYYSIFLIIICTIFFVSLKGIRSNNRLFKIILKVGIFRKIYFKYCELKFIQALYYMVNSGISIAPALKIMSEIENEVYTAYAKYIYDQVNQGFEFCESLRRAKIFESEIISIIKIGENSSNLSLSLKNIWVNYSKRYYEKLNKGTKLIEPIFILICGFLVIIFISIFILPLISYDNFMNIWEGI